jgi:hypothetical protein
MAAFSNRAVGATFSLLLLFGGCDNRMGAGGSHGAGNGGSGGSTGGGTGGNGASAPDLATATPSDMAMPSLPPRDMAHPASAGDLTLVSDATKFLGTWIYGTGATATTNCPGQPPSTDLSTSSFTVTLKSANTITLSAGASIACNIDFTVAGNTATVVPGQMCTVTQMGITATVAPNSGGTFVTSDGVTAQISASADVSASLVQCNADISASSAHR